MKKPHKFVRFFFDYQIFYYICVNTNKMKIKLTACMWALSLSLLLIFNSQDDFSFYTGIVLIIIQTLLWGNLMGKLKND